MWDYQGKGYLLDDEAGIEKCLADGVITEEQAAEARVIKAGKAYATCPSCIMACSAAINVLQHANGAKHKRVVQGQYSTAKIGGTLGAMWIPSLEAQRQFINQGAGPASELDTIWREHLNWLEPYSAWNMHQKPSRLPAFQTNTNSKGAGTCLADRFAAASKRSPYQDKAQRTDILMRPSPRPSNQESASPPMGSGIASNFQVAVAPPASLQIAKNFSASMSQPLSPPRSQASGTTSEEIAQHIHRSGPEEQGDLVIF